MRALYNIKGTTEMWPNKKGKTHTDSVRKAEMSTCCAVLCCAVYHCQEEGNNNTR